MSRSSRSHPLPDFPLIHCRTALAVSESKGVEALGSLDNQRCRFTQLPLQGLQRRCTPESATEKKYLFLSSRIPLALYHPAPITHPPRVRQPSRHHPRFFNGEEDFVGHQRYDIFPHELPSARLFTSLNCRGFKLLFRASTRFLH